MIFNYPNLRDADIDPSQHRTIETIRYREGLIEAQQMFRQDAQIAWIVREQDVFGGRYVPSSVVEPLPGSPEDQRPASATRWPR